MEGDSLDKPPPALVFQFQSTPSAWRATAEKDGVRVAVEISIHALRMEGDGRLFVLVVIPVISIHALRMEGDEMLKFGILRVVFQSTPSAWRATFLSAHPEKPLVNISIHALRMEGDAG